MSVPAGALFASRRKEHFDLSLPEHYLNATDRGTVMFARAIVHGKKISIYMGRAEEPILVCPLDDPDRDHNDEIDQLHKELGCPTLFVFHANVGKYVLYLPQDFVGIDMDSPWMSVYMKGPRP